MQTFNFPFETAGRRLLLGYGVAVLAVTAALTCILQMEAHWQSSAPVAILLIAIIVTTRLGGPRPALVATVLSVLGFACLVLPASGGSLTENWIQGVRLASLAAVAGYLVWLTTTQRNAVESLRHAHDELRRNNEALRLENMERRRNEELSRSAETKFRALAESAPAAILIYRQGSICYANPAASAITGYSAAELWNTEALQTMGPELRDLLTGRELHPASEHSPTHRELRIVTKTGEERWLDFTGVIFDFGGQPAVVGVGCDITERRLAEKALRSSQELLEQVLATLPVAVAVMNGAGDIVLSNAASKRIWGEYQAVAARERWVRARGYWHATGKRITPSEWASARALSLGQTSLDELIDIDTYDGRRKTIQNSAAPIRNAEGEIAGAVVVNEDVTQRVQAENALQASASRLKHLSHRLLTLQEEERRHLSRELHDEFGQLLATVTMQLRLAGKRLGEEIRGSLEESIALLQRAAEELRSLVLELRPTMLECSGLLATLTWLADQHQQRTGIATEVSGHAGDVPSDLAIACFRVAQEALTNVVRHGQARHVWIELCQHDKRVELVVSDDGTGFDVERTLGQAAARGSVGLLGMKERVEILGGDLEVESAPGAGTSIRVSIPMPSGVAPTAESGS